MGLTYTPRELSKLAQDLEPFIVARVRGSTAAGGGTAATVVAHRLNDTGIHTGQLDQSQASWALPAVTFTAHAADPDAHHAQATVDAPLAITGQDISLSLGHGVEESVGSLRVKLPTNSGIVRDSTGIYLSPSTVGPATTNGVTTSGHTHTVDSSSNPGAAAKILETATDGSITLVSVTVDEGFTAADTAFRIINHTHDYPHTHVVVNPGVSWTLDEQFGVDIDDNLLVRGYIVGKHAIQLPGALLIAHYDGPLPYESNFKGEPNGHMGQVATGSGGVIYRPGKFGKAVQVAAAATNVISNPSFETNTTGWSAILSASIARTNEGAVIGSYCAGVTTAGSNTGGVTFAYTTSTGGAWTASVYLKAYTAADVGDNVSVRIRFNYTDVTTADTAVNHALAADWTRVSVSATANGAKTVSSIEVHVRDLLSQSAHQWLMDAVQLEVGAIASPYCDGTLGDGHTWSGTAHASTSSRTAGSLTYPTAGSLPTNVGTVMAWVAPSYLHPTDAQTVLRASGTTAGHIMLRLNSVGKPQAYWGTGAVTAASAITAGAWTHVAMTYDGATVSLYVNGVLSTSGASSGFSGMPASMYVGVYSGAEWFGGLLDDLVILDRAAAADEIRAVYESNAPVFAETSTWHWRSGRNRVYSDAEGLWMLGASGSAVIGAYAGDDANPSATKSWGGVTMAEGDVVIGHNQSGSAAMVWDRSAGKFQFVGNGSATVQAEIDTEGRVSAGAGKIVLGANGARLALGSSRTTYLSTTDGARIMWSAAEIYETLEEDWTYLSTTYYRRSLVARTVTDGTDVSHTEIAAIHDYSGTNRGPRIILEAGANVEDYTATFAVDEVIVMDADMIHVTAPRVRIENDTGTSYLEVYQGNSSGAVPTLTLSQADLSEELIRFNGTVSSGNPINTTALGAYYGRVRVTVNGTAKWLALYS
jgi:hypothetical protein